MLSNEDLKEIGVPMGPRKKLSGFIIEWNQIKQIEEVYTVDTPLVVVGSKLKRYTL